MIISTNCPTKTINKELNLLSNLIKDMGFEEPVYDVKDYDPVIDFSKSNPGVIKIEVNGESFTISKVCHDYIKAEIPLAGIEEVYPLKTSYYDFVRRDISLHLVKDGFIDIASISQKEAEEVTENDIRIEKGNCTLVWLACDNEYLWQITKDSDTSKTLFLGQDLKSSLLYSIKTIADFLTNNYISLDKIQDTGIVTDIVSEIIALAKENDMTIGTVESCTSGLLASTLTDVEGASAVIKNAFVTYSNDAKIEAGVSAKVIKEYGVYSIQTAEEMAQVALNHRNTIGIGITGTLGNVDPNNRDSNPMTFSYCIRCRHAIPFTKTSTIPNIIVGRKAQKEYVCNTILKSLITYMKEVTKCKNTN